MCCPPGSADCANLCSHSHGCDEDALHTKRREEGLQVACQPERHWLTSLQDTPAGRIQCLRGWHKSNHSLREEQKQTKITPFRNSQRCIVPGCLCCMKNIGSSFESQPKLTGYIYIYIYKVLFDKHDHIPLSTICLCKILVHSMKMSAKLTLHHMTGRSLSGRFSRHCEQSRFWRECGLQ